MLELAEAAFNDVAAAVSGLVEPDRAPAPVAAATTIGLLVARLGDRARPGSRPRPSGELRVRAEAELERARAANPRIGLDEVRALLADLVREAPAP